MGFMLEWEGQPGGPFYISGDTVWIDEILEIARRFTPSARILHLGAANVPAVGENYLTMSSVEGARAAKALGLSGVHPAHFEGWAILQPGLLVDCTANSKGGVDQLPGAAASGRIAERGRLASSSSPASSAG